MTCLSIYLLNLFVWIKTLTLISATLQHHIDTMNRIFLLQLIFEVRHFHLKVRVAAKMPLVLAWIRVQLTFNDHIFACVWNMFYKKFILTPFFLNCSRLIFLADKDLVFIKLISNFFFIYKWIHRAKRNLFVLFIRNITHRFFNTFIRRTVMIFYSVWCPATILSHTLLSFIYLLIY